MQTEARVTRSRAKALNTPLTAPLPYGGPAAKRPENADIGEGDATRKALFELPNTSAKSETPGPKTIGNQTAKKPPRVSEPCEKENDPQAIQGPALTTPVQSQPRAASQQVATPKQPQSPVPQTPPVAGLDKAVLQDSEPQTTPIATQMQETVVGSPELCLASTPEVAPTPEATPLTLRLGAEEIKPCSIAPPGNWGFLQAGQTPLIATQLGLSRTPIPPRAEPQLEDTVTAAAFGSPISAQEAANQTPTPTAQKSQAATPANTPVMQSSPAPYPSSEAPYPSTEACNVQLEFDTQSGDFDAQDRQTLQELAQPRLLPGDLSRMEVALSPMTSSASCDSMTAQADSEQVLPDSPLRDLTPAHPVDTSQTPTQVLSSNPSCAQTPMQSQTKALDSRACSDAERLSEVKVAKSTPLPAAHQEEPSLDLQDTEMDDQQAEEDLEDDKEPSPLIEPAEPPVQHHVASKKFEEKVAKLDARHKAKLVPAQEASLDRWEMDGEVPALYKEVPSSKPVSKPKLQSSIDASRFDPRSLRQLRKEVKAAVQEKPKAAGIKISPTNSAASSVYTDVHRPSQNAESGEVTSLARAIGGMKLAQSPEPLRGVPVPEGRHTRFDDEGHAELAPERVILRGVPKARGTHTRFD